MPSSQKHAEGLAALPVGRSYVSSAVSACWESVARRENRLSQLPRMHPMRLETAPTHKANTPHSLTHREGGGDTAERHARVLTVPPELDQHPDDSPRRTNCCRRVVGRPAAEHGPPVEVREAAGMMEPAPSGRCCRDQPSCPGNPAGVRFGCLQGKGAIGKHGGAGQRGAQ